MNLASPWSRFGIFLACVVLLFGAFWVVRSAETPPWRQNPEAPSPGSSHEEPPRASTGELAPFRFVNYNLKNWLLSSQNPPKSPSAKSAVIHLLTTAAPDVIGLCEIGSDADLAEIQIFLKKAGTDLPHRHHTGGTDTVRHLGILSRFPIVSTRNPPLKIPGGGQTVQRGILDATLRIGSRRVRFIGLHLKSKRPVPDFDQALLRLAEAGHVRKYIDGILAADPSAALVVYGDFNDHIRSLGTRAILGKYRSPLYLQPVSLKDSRGETWTHYFSRRQIYSRIDFVTVSKAFRKHVDESNSAILDDPAWSQASDHRPLLVAFE